MPRKSEGFFCMRFFPFDQFILILMIDKIFIAGHPHPSQLAWLINPQVCTCRYRGKTLSMMVCGLFIPSSWPGYPFASFPCAKPTRLIDCESRTRVEGQLRVWLIRPSSQVRIRCLTNLDWLWIVTNVCSSAGVFRIIINIINIIIIINIINIVNSDHASIVIVFILNLIPQVGICLGSKTTGCLCALFDVLEMLPSVNLKALTAQVWLGCWLSGCACMCIWERSWCKSVLAEYSTSQP